MKGPYQTLGKINNIDKCRKYFPRFDEKTFLEEVEYTENELLNYFPKTIVQEYQSFKQAGQILKVGFWIGDILWVTFCHKIKVLNRLLGQRTWGMFLFKLSCIALPLTFIQNIQQNARDQFLKTFYKKTHKFYQRYKQTGDILYLNRFIFLEQSESAFQKAQSWDLNKFNLLHGSNQNLSLLK